MDELLDPQVGFIIVKNWDITVTSLQQQAGLEALVVQMGFDLQTLVATLNREFPKDITLTEVNNPAGEKIEDVGTETITVNDRPLDRLSVMAYPSAANANPEEMTRFKSGGEVILLVEGEAEITYAPRVRGEFIPKSDLKSARVKKGDLIISADTPNNWTRVYGDKFTFTYFVGNPDGPQRYGDIPKVKVPVK